MLECTSRAVSRGFSAGYQTQSRCLTGRVKVGSHGSLLKDFPPGPGRAAGKAKGNDGWARWSDEPPLQWKPWGAPLWLSHELLAQA